MIGQSLMTSDTMFHNIICHFTYKAPIIRYFFPFLHCHWPIYILVPLYPCTKSVRHAWHLIIDVLLYTVVSLDEFQLYFLHYTRYLNEL